MFLQHNFKTRLAYWAVALSSVIGVVSLTLIASQLITTATATLVYVLIYFLFAMLILNTFFAYKIHKRSKKALMLCLLLYGIQIFGFETEHLAFSLNFGFQLTISVPFYRFSLSANFAAVIIWLIVYSALKSVRKQVAEKADYDSGIVTNGS